MGIASFNIKNKKKASPLKLKRLFFLSIKVYVTNNIKFGRFSH